MCRAGHELEQQSIMSNAIRSAVTNLFDYYMISLTVGRKSQSRNTTF